MTATAYARTDKDQALYSFVSLTTVPTSVSCHVAYSTEARPVTAAYLAAEDAEWDAVAARHSAALDALLASLTERAKHGEDRPLDLDELED